jgi:hypothetical protein
VAIDPSSSGVERQRTGELRRNAKCIMIDERLSSIHTFVVSRSRGGTLSLANFDHIHGIFVVMLEEARRG